MKLYVVRHGQTQYNIEHKFQGQIDVPLNEVGIKQAQDVSSKMADIYIDMIISSPLSRALDTAKAIQEKNNVPIVINDQLMERRFGEFEGLIDISKFDCTIDKLLDYTLNYNLHNVEPLQDLFKRVHEFLIYCNNNYPDKTICIATHNGIVQVLECLLNNLPATTNLQSLSLDNCEYRMYDEKCLSEYFNKKKVLL